ncbi:MAG: hypothetical protein K2L81_07975, partial [Muribaculaceae bacterium]|nr:hypothetical protein [Muribaculaceae bacterium]
MRRITTLLIILISAVTMASAVTHIYLGANTYPSKILYTWDGKHLYAGPNAYSSKILYTRDGKHLNAGA